MSRGRVSREVVVSLQEEISQISTSLLLFLFFAVCLVCVCHLVRQVLFHKLQIRKYPASISADSFVPSVLLNVNSSQIIDYYLNNDRGVL